MKLAPEATLNAVFVVHGSVAVTPPVLLMFTVLKVAPTVDDMVGETVPLKLAIFNVVVPLNAMICVPVPLHVTVPVLIKLPLLLNVLDNVVVPVPALKVPAGKM